MQHNGWNLLSNISVRAKLTLGFSLLIGMILLVAYTGWQATDALRDRSELDQLQWLQRGPQGLLARPVHSARQ